MQFGKHESLGVATGKAIYPPAHYDGIALIPLGNRERDKPEYGVEYLEERDSVDKYSKYIRP